MRQATLRTPLILLSCLLSLLICGCAVRATTAPPPAYPSEPAEQPSRLPPPPQQQPLPEPTPPPQPVPPPEPIPPPPPVWNASGWTLLGEQSVDGRRDRDKIKIGRDEGKFSRLTMVVLDSDLELIELEIKFGNGKPFRPEVRHLFNENTRTRVIDLPGDRRVIKWIELRYRNLPGGGRARVQIWAQ